MSGFKTSLTCVAIITAGLGVFATTTHGFSAFTTETALRLSVQHAPRIIPRVPLQAADGQPLELGGRSTAGRWWVVGFMYTRCTTVCLAQGSAFALLHEELSAAMTQGRVGLLNISFDPGRDTPAALRHWQAGLTGQTQPGRLNNRSADTSTHYSHVTGWRVARPMNQDDLHRLLRVFGVKTIADGLGGFEHNAAFNLIDPQGHLVAVFDWADPQAVVDRLQQELAP